MKTSLTQIDIVKRINKYVELRKKENKIDSYDLRDKSLNLFRYIDKHWNSFKGMNNTEFLSLQWIPTTDKTGQETFSYLREMDAMIKKTKIYESPSLRDHLRWNKPPTNFILEQMHQCSTMSEDYLNFKNRLQICEAIYEHINKALSSNDKKYEAKHSSLTESKLSEIIKLLEHIANERTNFKEKGQICDLKDLLIPSTDSTLLRHEDIYFDDRPKLHKAAKNYKISYPKITLELAEKLGIQMLSSKFLNCSQIEFEALEHSVDENDFSNHKNQIGHVVIVSSYYLTNILSFVSRKNATFLDPHVKFLSLQGYSPKQPRKIKFNFHENEFSINFKDQCEPYLAIEGCDFKNEFKGTLFKLLLRNTELSKQSLILQNSIKFQEILDYFQNMKNHQELIFLRNIELYNVYHIDKYENKHLIWEIEIPNLSDNDRDIRRKVENTPQIFQFNTKLYDTKKTTFETWLVCMGGNSEKSMDNNLVNFSKQEKLEAYSGVSAILAQSDNEDDLIVWCAYKWQFCWSIDGKDILKLNNNGDYEKWNRHILLEVLPSLHIKLLNEIVKKDLESEKFVPYTTKKFFFLGNGKETENKLIDSYRAKVLQSLGNNEVFWTEADGDKFISLKNAYFFEKRDHIIADILSKHGIPTVKMDKNKLSYVCEKIKGKKSIKYQSIKFSEILRKNGNILSDIEQDQNDFANIIKLLEFILQDKDDYLYSNLKGLRLVPLKNCSCGTFGECDYYIANKRCQELFPISGPFRFVYDSDELIKIFEYEYFSNLHIKKLDTQGILDLFTKELPNKWKDWDPSSKANPYQQ
ncbi:15075_t:CDS:2 [Gigaspora margarita]|uniref:15075_t:CDS:1 n=1 Tax=Gigaspora margarita TaxID=4874 RepID=A0ABN7VWY4_GIGMA|nr:15075_t:CDS:2 [Gigaspora margarita]